METQHIVLRRENVLEKMKYEQNRNSWTKEGEKLESTGTKRTKTTQYIPMVCQKGFMEYISKCIKETYC